MIRLAAILGLGAVVLILWRSGRPGETLADRLERLRHDPTPFGEALARRMWRQVMGSAIGQGILPERHKEYCGHGLVRAPEGVVLCEVFDMQAQIEHPLASWTEEAEFVAFFARQSNRSTNGFDPAEPTFFTDDEWARANQRLTREAIVRAL